MFDRAVLALPGARRLLALLILTALVDALAAVAQAWGIAAAVVGLWEGSGLSGQVGWVALFLGAFLTRQLVAFGRSRATASFARRQAGSLRSQLMARVYQGGQGLVSATGTGALTAAVLEGVDQVQRYLSLIMPRIADVVVVPLVLLVFLFSLDWVSALVALVLFPVIIMFMVLLGNATKARAARQYGEFQALSNHFTDSLRGIGTLKLFGRAEGHGRRVFEVSERFREATLRTLRMATTSSLVLDLAATFGLAAISILLGFRLLAGQIAFFPALAVLVIVPDYFGPLRRFAGDFHASLDGKNALAQINRLLAGDAGGKDGAAVQAARDAGGKDGAAVQAGRDAGAAVTQARRDAGGQGTSEQTASCATHIPPWGENTTLELHDITFTWHTRVAGEAQGQGQAAPSLEGVSLTLRGFSHVGIVGASGAGKSTLANLLAGFSSPDSGALIFRDETTGETLTCGNLSRDDWRRQVTYIPQSPHIFHASLHDNVAFYRPDATDAEVARAIEAVGLDELADRLPQGAQTVIGQGARQLSGGQAQRIALARAFLDSDRRVLVFDEPTAHLDIETELALKERMLPLMEGRLVLFATHRMHWMRNMDLVAVLDRGRLVQFGTPSDLLKDSDGAFARLVLESKGASR